MFVGFVFFLFVLFVPAIIEKASTSPGFLSSFQPFLSFVC